MKSTDLKHLLPHVYDTTASPDRAKIETGFLAMQQTAGTALVQIFVNRYEFGSLL
jgi:hypothetical protein